MLKAFCQWKQLFSLEASDGLEKEVHPPEECGAKYGVENLKQFAPSYTWSTIQIQYYEF